MQVAPPNNMAVTEVALAYELVTNRHVFMNGFIGYSAQNGGQFFCNATGQEFQVMQLISELSTGRLYPVQQGTIRQVEDETNERNVRSFKSSPLITVRLFSIIASSPIVSARRNMSTSLLTPIPRPCNLTSTATMRTRS